MQHFKTQISFRILKKHLGSAWILLCVSKKLKMKFKAAIIIVDIPCKYRSFVLHSYI